MRIGISQRNYTIGAIVENLEKVLEAIEWAKSEGDDLLVFPEMTICGYPAEDLHLQPLFIEAEEKALELIVKSATGISVILGLSRKGINIGGGGKPLRNSAAIIVDGKLIGFQDKMLLPTYDVFDERRYFEPASDQKVWHIAGKRVGVTICEDIWPFTGQFCNEQYFVDPLRYFEKRGIDLLVNVSASPYSVSSFAPLLSKPRLRQKLVASCARRLGCPVVLCNQLGAQDGLLFDGSSVVVSEDGSLLYQAKTFQEDRGSIDLATAKPIQGYHEEISSEIFAALSMGVKDYFAKNKLKTACLGLSGGIDSSLVACIAVHALGNENVHGYLLPSRFTSEESVHDAEALAYNLGIATKTISIEDSFKTYLSMLKPILGNEPFGVTEENIQSRIRGNILMAISNKTGDLLLCTGNKSEIAVGYTTLYGDSCGAVSVIGDLLKSQVYQVAKWVSKTWGWIPQSILVKEPTAELRSDQKDSDSLPEYAILDQIVEEHVVQGLTAQEIVAKHDFSIDLVSWVIKKIYTNEYKRRQCPFALRISEKAFSSGRRMPIVQGFY